MRRVAYQGEPGSYSEEAFWRHFGGRGLQPVSCASFEDVVQHVVAGESELALLPVENSRTGAIEETARLAEAAGLVWTERFWTPMDQCLIGHEEASVADIKRAYSHPLALQQVKGFLARHGIEPVETEDTAGAVREVRDRGKPEEAAVASRRAAALHRMTVLAMSIHDEAGNRTRFAVYRRR